jgi:hypothetical protein
MDNALRNAFPVEVSQFFHQVKTCMRIGSRSPAVKEFWLSATGIPLAVVNVLPSVIVGKLIAAS